MNKKSLERGQAIMRNLNRISYDLKELRKVNNNNPADNLLWNGTDISAEAAIEIRSIAIKSLINKRRRLQREFKKL